MVRLSSNENPYGPSPKALKAMTDAFGLACRYPDDTADLLIDALAKTQRRRTAIKFCWATAPARFLKFAQRHSPDRRSGKNATGGRGKLVVADPTFEAILAHAKF